MWVDMAKRLFAAASKGYTFDKDSTTVLDFACGTGMSSNYIRRSRSDNSMILRPLPPTTCSSGQIDRRCRYQPRTS
jgi:hypothetical protein